MDMDANTILFLPPPPSRKTTDSQLLSLIMQTSKL